MDEKSKVYIFLDGEKITACEGGYTMSNIEDISEWLFIDGGLYTEDGIKGGQTWAIYRTQNLPRV